MYAPTSSANPPEKQRHVIDTSDLETRKCRLQVTAWAKNNEAKNNEAGLKTTIAGAHAMLKTTKLSSFFFFLSRARDEPQLSPRNLPLH